MGHPFDMLTFDFLLKLPQPIAGLFLSSFVVKFERVVNGLEGQRSCQLSI